MRRQTGIDAASPRAIMLMERRSCARLLEYQDSVRTHDYRSKLMTLTQTRSAEIDMELSHTSLYRPNKVSNGTRPPTHQQIFLKLTNRRKKTMMNHGDPPEALNVGSSISEIPAPWLHRTHASHHKAKVGITWLSAFLLKSVSVAFWIWSPGALGEDIKVRTRLRG